MEQKDYIELVEERFGDIGELLKSEINYSRFPFTYHHDFLRGFSKLKGIDGILSRGEAGRLLREAFPDKVEYTEELIKGALAYILDSRKEQILRLFLTESPQETQIYKDIYAYTQTYWLFNENNVAKAQELLNTKVIV